jgi:hypothetical protein
MDQHLKKKERKKIKKENERKKEKKERKRRKRREGTTRYESSYLFSSRNQKKLPFLGI